MEKIYDLLVIGWGKVGKILFVKFGVKGKKVVIIEENFKMYGGICINVGCLLMKFFVYSVKILVEVKKYGIDGDYLFKNNFFKEVMKKKEEMMIKLRNKNFGLLDINENVDIYNGRVSFVLNNEVKIIFSDNKEIVLKVDKIVINIGFVLRILNIEGIDNKNVMISEGILELKKLLKKFLIIGVGYIGFEFVLYFLNFGSEVFVF